MEDIMYIEEYNKYFCFDQCLITLQKILTNVNSDMVVKKRWVKFRSFLFYRLHAFVKIAGINFVGIVFVEIVFVETAFVTSIFSSAITTESPIECSNYLLFS